MVGNTMELKRQIATMVTAAKTPQLSPEATARAAAVSAQKHSTQPAGMLLSAPPAKSLAETGYRSPDSTPPLTTPG